MGFGKFMEFMSWMSLPLVANCSHFSSAAKFCQRNLFSGKMLLYHISPKERRRAPWHGDLVVQLLATELDGLCNSFARAQQQLPRQITSNTDADKV